jgi:serine/threonine-protein kinase
VSGTPRSFGKYLLEREIARGGMARVHLATLRGLGGFEKRLVVKEILPELASDPKFVSMFVEEAKVLVALSHPNIVPVYELGIVDGTYFLAMEHVQGATLAELVRERRLAPAEAARVGAEIADALAYAHERFDIVHRDVSPRNVMVDSTGHARLLDFGIAARADVGEGDALYGTPGFLSPEQARGEKLSAASDLFSLGCVLVYATRGASPFGPDEVDRLRALDAAPSLETDDRSAALDRIASELLAPSPTARPTARAVARSLAAAATALEQGDGATATLATRAGAASKHTEEHRTPAAPPSGPVTPGRVETLATSQALEAIIATANIRPPADSPRTARIDRAPATSRAPAIVLAIGAAVLAAWLVSTARFELAPVAPIDEIDRGLTSPADIEPLPVIDEDADVAANEDAAIVVDASTPDAGIRARDAAPRASATLSVNATPWADVTLDGHALGHTPLRRATIGAGTHTIALHCPPLGRHVERSFRAEAGAALEISADLESDPPSVRGP